MLAEPSDGKRLLARARERQRQRQNLSSKKKT